MQPLAEQSHLDEIIKFLQENSHIFETPNYEFLSKKIYSIIDQEWLVYMSNLDFEQLRRLPTEWGDFQDCPTSLKHFFGQASRLSFLAELVENKADDSVTDQLLRNIKGIKPKKLHELTNFSRLVKDECCKLGVRRVVDVGCGLGHMLDFLSSKCSKDQPIESVGIETNQQFCSSAKKRYGDFTNIKCAHFAADDAQTKDILSAAEDRKTALISLHGCGDLQPMLLKEFICLPDATPLLMTIGCCYHKMADIDSWPMSNAVRMSLSRLKNPWKPSRSAFRLACQQRMSSWKNISEQEHESHKQNFMNRVIVECFYKELGIAGQAQERGFNRKMGNSQLELESSILRKNNITCHQQADLWRSKFRQISAQHQHIAEFVEPFTALQFALQGVLETLILWDRMFYLRENGMRAHLKAVFNSQLSPRNMCLVGIKNVLL